MFSSSDLKAPRLSEEIFGKIRQLVFKHLGITLSDQKKPLMVNRLWKVLRQRGFSSFEEYYRFLVQDSTGQALAELADHISTHYTYFYRETEQFDFFVKTVLPAAVARQHPQTQSELRIWSAGCSSGEEPYTLQMLMFEFFAKDYALWNAGVLATDISDTILREAREGSYEELQMRYLPATLSRKYFRKLPGGQWAIREEVKKEITFRKLNLINLDFPFQKAFDIIFCRNVMIYFDIETRQALIERFIRYLTPGGYLFIGLSEALLQRPQELEYIQPAIYRRREVE